ncbi:unnamed protein product, partial [Choristocarpus tenellus]
QTTNTSNYQLLGSNDVSIFFDNSFVAKTCLPSVAPGESFQICLGVDTAVKVTRAPSRCASKEGGLFAKNNSTSFTYRLESNLLINRSTPWVGQGVGLAPSCCCFPDVEL